MIQFPLAPGISRSVALGEIKELQTWDHLIAWGIGPGSRVSWILCSAEMLRRD